MTSNPYENVNAYSKNQNSQVAPTGNSRDTDSRALLACARRLDDAKQLMQDDMKSKENLKLYGEAVRHNQRLWTIFQVALSDPQNPLPQDLKVTLLNLSRYVDRTSFNAVGKYRPDLIDSLVNINRIIAAGLSKQPTGDAVLPPPDARDIPLELMTSA
jgi:flagellar protein FlaF